MYSVLYELYNLLSALYDVLSALYKPLYVLYYIQCHTMYEVLRCMNPYSLGVMNTKVRQIW